MNQAHLHLLVTHLPIFGSIIGALVLSYGLWTKSNQTKNAAYFIFIISAIGAGIAYLTGEGAEHAVKHIQGVTKNLIEVHEDAAMYALVSLMVLGAMSVITLVLGRFKTSFTRSTATIILVLSLISFGLVARTGYLGGQIRHTEISTDATLNNHHGSEARDKDDD